MLTYTALRNTKPGATPCGLADPDGMYITVSTTGTITFLYDYCLIGRRETLAIGRYGSAGISLAMAREKLLDAKRAIGSGVPAMEKQREKSRLTEAKTFGEFTVR